MGGAGAPEAGVGADDPQVPGHDARLRAGLPAGAENSCAIVFCRFFGKMDLKTLNQCLLMNYSGVFSFCIITKAAHFQLTNLANHR